MLPPRPLQLPRLLPALLPALLATPARAQLDRATLDVTSEAAHTTPAAATPVSTPAPTEAATTPANAAATPTPALTTPTPTQAASAAIPTNDPASSSVGAAASVINATTPASAHPSTAAASTPTPAQSVKPQSSSIIYLTITATGADGNVYTSVSSSASAVPLATGLSSSGGGGGGTSGSTWAIIGGVVGGLAALAAIIFIVFRCTQRRFSELDDEDVAIKWPELVNRADDSSTLNPLAARQAAGHGVGDDGEDEKPGMSPNQVGLYSDHAFASELNRGDTLQSTMYSNNSYAGAGPGGYGEHANYYPDDPYLGPTSAPQPFPPAIPFDQQQHPSYAPLAPPSPYTTTRSLSPGHAPDQEPEGYQMSWGGAEAIPLTVVNPNNGTAAGRRTPSPPDHRTQ